MATEFDSGGDSKRQRTDTKGKQSQRDVEEAEKDHISTLPEALRLHILALLPLKSAIRTGALSTQWRALWTRRWPVPSSLEFRVPAQESSQQLMGTIERRRRRRLDRFSLSFQIGELNSGDFRRFLDYAAACAVADLDVHLLSDANEVSGRVFKFRLPPDNPHLERLSLDGIRVDFCNSFCFEPGPYSVLAAIHLHRVTVSDATVFNLVAACPLLSTLDLRYCKGLRAGNFPTGPSLKSVTVAECENIDDVFIREASGLRSFRYRGGYLDADQIPTIVDDLYLCFGGPGRCHSSRTTTWSKTNDGEWRLCKMRTSCLDALINVSNLTVLTLCSSALREFLARLVPNQ